MFFFPSAIYDWCICLTCQSCHPTYQQIFDCIYFWHKCNILVGVWIFYISCSDQYRENFIIDVHVSKHDWKKSTLTDVEWLPFFFSRKLMCCKKHTCVLLQSLFSTLIAVCSINSHRSNDKLPHSCQSWQIDFKKRWGGVYKFWL